MAFVQALGNPGVYETNLYAVMAFAARYGHQQVESMGRMEVDNLIKFNEALRELIERENKSGGGLMNRLATGG